MMKHLVLVGALVYGLGGCSFKPSDPQVSAKENSTPQQEAQDEIKTSLIAESIDGDALYANHCALCHGPLANSQKLDKSAEQITWAITNIPAMSSREDLLALSSSEIQQISNALVSEPVEPLAEKKPLVGNRFYLESLFTELFINEVSPDKGAVGVINKNISRQGSFLGGVCDRRSRTNCYNPTEIKGSMNPQSHVLRQGLIAKTCDEVLQRKSALNTILAHIDLKSNDEVTRQGLSSAFALFASSRQLDEASLSALMELSEKSYSIRNSKSDRWRFPLIAICQSAIIEMI